jgi:hypothetical protein
VQIYKIHSKEYVCLDSGAVNAVIDSFIQLEGERSKVSALDVVIKQQNNFLKQADSIIANKNSIILNYKTMSQLQVENEIILKNLHKESIKKLKKSNTFKSISFTLLGIFLGFGMSKL